jgi:uncharacterized membrane protein/protein-disulfide isomerase
MVSRTGRTLLLLFSLLGLGASTAATYTHYRLLAAPETATSFCDVSAAVSCSQAYLSAYGSILGVPVALLGLLFFALVTLIVLLVGRAASPARENVAGYVLALSTPGLAFAAYLAWASYVVLGTFCILCGLTYVAIAGLFIASLRSLPFPVTHLLDHVAHDARRLVASPAAIGIALLFVAGAATAIAAFPHEPPLGAVVEEQQAGMQPLSEADFKAVEEWWNMQPVVDVPVPAAGAKVVIVKFNDCQCPACGVTHNLYKPVIAKYTSSGTGDVRYVLKHYPLEGECNPAMARMNHYGACEAAAGVIMARALGTSQKLEDWFFANIGPPMLTSVQMKEAARDVAGVKDFDAQYSKALEQVRADAELGAKLNVRGTPTFFVNGRRIPTDSGMPQANVLDAIIQIELKRAK